MRLDIITIFPDYLTPLELSLVGKARSAGILELHVHDLRHWTTDRHRTVDDAPYGGGPGMVMRADVWGQALDAVITSVPAAPPPTLVIPTPSGQPFTQAHAQAMSGREWLIIACGRYEGIDARVAEHYRSVMPVDELSIGDVVLAGGEVAALVMVEAVARLLPGVLGNEASAPDDSFAPDRPTGAVLEGPVFTRPREWRGLAVPEVLLSGDHGAVARWRHEQSADRTRRMRPDLATDGYACDTNQPSDQAEET